MHDQVRQNRVHVFWEEGNKNRSDYFTKYHVIWNHRTMRPIILKPTQNIYLIIKTREMETYEGVLELAFLG